jgi:1,4-dihydroxy-2-naphthoyl-CoA hydrolase
MIWKTKPSAEFMRSFTQKNMADHLSIEITEVGDDFITARMPVDERTVQPFGLLHGGASCVLAETLGSIAGTFCINPEKQMVVGIEINANHIRSAKSGYVYGTVKPIHVGKSTQVWNIEIVNEEKKLICVSRLTCAVKDLM